MAAPPSFSQVLPTETDATDGDIVTFQVKVSSDPDDPTVVSWWRCGESLRPIVGKREIISHDDGWHELILSNITEEDEGEYECRAENNRGHNSCFGSLYYYREGGGYTMTDVAMEELAAEGDGRQSGLLILIDDGSQTDECPSGDSNRKSMTISEQMQGIIEDLTHSSSQGERTGSMTLEKDDENQFYSDIEELCDDDLESNVIQNILGMSKKQVSEETLVPEMPSPDITADLAVSEGAPDPYAPTTVNQTQKWRSNPNNVSKIKREKEQAREKEGDGVWPPDATMVTFDLPLDTETTSVELPFAKEGSTEEEAHKSSLRCVGAETPFDVADITEEAVDGSSSKDAGSLRHSPTDGVTTENFGAESGTEVVASQEVILAAKLPTDSSAAPRIDPDTSLTSVTEISGEAILLEGRQQSKMSFTRSSFKSSAYQYSDDTVTSLRSSSVTSRMSSTTFGEESVSYHRSSRMTRTAGELDDDSLSLSTTAKRTKLSSAYEADESSLSMPSKTAIFSEAFRTEVPTEIKMFAFHPPNQEWKCHNISTYSISSYQCLFLLLEMLEEEYTTSA